MTDLMKDSKATNDVKERSIEFCSKIFSPSVSENGAFGEHHTRAAPDHFVFLHGHCFSVLGTSRLQNPMCVTWFF